VPKVIRERAGRQVGFACAPTVHPNGHSGRKLMRIKVIAVAPQYEVGHAKQSPS